MAPRAVWKGRLQIAELSCAVALHTAASTSERIGFHTLNRATGNRVRRQFVDAETGKPVESEDQVKGYALASGEYVVLDPDEIAAAVPESDKTLAVSDFIACQDIDDTYFDRPYYLTPADRAAQEAFALIREGMARRKVAALARAVLFRRVRTVLIRADDAGMIATTLNFDHEVRPAAEVFRDIPARRIKGEMLELAEHIIKTKMGEFDISGFDDRYDAALAELVKARIEGRKITPRKPAPRENVVDLMTALRESAGVAKKASSSRKAPAGKKPAPRRKSG
ncbi:Ku protein [Paracoccus aminovorans]|uniref:non-homologous end joining protein Ku n=1 Tax=Paracoccus aminovorans TaxID=34004 RepID=UPI0007830FAA|nr:Ku protein [Paracoccus aminovorans]MDQ7774393.1 Ku protein [Paracoccus aminovorans]